MASASSLQHTQGSWFQVSAHVPLAEATAQGVPIGRSSHAACLLESKLLVFSGENTPRVPVDDAVHIFDLVQRKWSRMDRTGEAAWPQARIGHAGCAISSTASFYIHGGRTEFAEDATLEDLWRFKDGQWEELRTTGQRPPPLSYHVATSHGRYLYLFGGCTNDHGRINGLWQLDTTSLVWSLLFSPSTGAEDAPAGRGGPSIAAAADRVWVGFGYNGKEEQSDLWFFELSSKCWQRVHGTGSLPTARSVTDMVLLDADLDKPALFIFGGEFTPSAQGHEGAGQYHDDAFVFDITASNWKRIAATNTSPCSRGWFTTHADGAGGVIVFGGFDGRERRNDIYRWTNSASK